MASESATIEVTGIRCERCVMRLASALEAEPGIEEARATLQGEVVLTWNAEVTSREHLTSVLAGAGFHERE